MALSKKTIIASNIITKTNQPIDVIAQDGLVLLVNKPKDWTSFDVVNKIRFACKHTLKLKKIKVGHAGTLDPLATGLLMVCIGKYTKLIDDLSSKSKAYEAEIKLGATTASYDAECEEVDINALFPREDGPILSAIKTFEGDILQKPPIYSAIKIGGKEAYKFARAGKEVEMKLRPVTIHEFTLKEYKAPFAKVFIHCSKGTYIRSMAHDLGQILGCGGYLTSLVRTSIDEYQLSDALELDAVLDYIHQLPAAIPQ